MVLWTDVTTATATATYPVRECQNCIFYKADVLFAGKGLCQKYHIDGRETYEHCDQWQSEYYHETSWYATPIATSDTTAT